MMNKISRTISSVAFLLLIPFSLCGANPAMISYNSESTDTATITKILIEASNANLPVGETISFIGSKFIGKPYETNTLEGDAEMLRINMDSFDCTTFVETVIALAKSALENRTSWHDFIFNLENIRYRNGKLDGYPSRLHYNCDWIANNIHRGNLTDVTERIGTYAIAVKTIDYMSANSSKYPALSSEANLNAIKSMETGYHNHRIPYIKTQNISKANIKTGDIIAITTALKNLDATHIGIAIMLNGKIHLLHASSKEGKVTISKFPLDEYLRRNKTATGARIVRLTL